MKYLNEQKMYSKSDLSLDNDTIHELIDKRIISKMDNDLFVLNFVGIVILKEDGFICLPKFTKNSNKKVVARQILTLFKEYCKREHLDQNEIESFGNLACDNFTNKLSVMIYILDDYYENGLYLNEKRVNIVNGDNEINWSKTIDELQPYINNDEIIYLSYFTNLSTNNEDSYFRMLHCYILNECSRQLNNFGLLDFFGYEPISYQIDEDRLGTTQEIIENINNELNVQFVDRKQLLLMAMASYLKNRVMGNSQSLITFYGTRSFHVVWEKTCGYVLNNQYNYVKKYIANPQWKTSSGKVHKVPTLIPDIISMTENTFIISDAKYYSLDFTDEILSGNPGVEDIAKQYLYHLAFKDLIKKHKFSSVKNYLLFPYEEKEIKQVGIVTIKFLKDLDLEDICVLYLPAHLIFELYIDGDKLDVENFFNLKIKISKII